MLNVCQSQGQRIVILPSVLTLELYLHFEYRWDHFYFYHFGLIVVSWGLKGIVSYFCTGFQTLLFLTSSCSSSGKFFRSGSSIKPAVR